MVSITPEAAEKIKELLNESGDKYLRLGVQGGGCSGLEYMMGTEEEKSDMDSEFESNGIKIVIDPASRHYLKDATVEFVETDMGGGFKITNPNAQSTCGCGQSFNPK